MREALGKQMKPRPAGTLSNSQMDRYATARACWGRQLFTGKCMRGHWCVRGVLACVCCSKSMEKAFQTEEQAVCIEAGALAAQEWELVTWWNGGKGSADSEAGRQGRGEVTPCDWKACRTSPSWQPGVPSTAPPTSLPAPLPLSLPVSRAVHRQSTLPPTSGPLYMLVPLPGIFFPRSSPWLDPSYLTLNAVDFLQRVPPCL